MSYTDAKYNVRIPYAYPPDGLVSTGTFTASDHVITAANVGRIEFNRACVLTGGRSFTRVGSTSKVNKVVLMRGTNTVSSSTIAAVNSGADFGAPTSNTFTAGEQLGVNIIHTGTASANQASGTLDLNVEYQEQFA